jgi:hypothetical protein
MLSKEFKEFKSTGVQEALNGHLDASRAGKRPGLLSEVFRKLLHPFCCPAFLESRRLLNSCTSELLELLELLPPAWQFAGP